LALTDPAIFLRVVSPVSMTGSPSPTSACGRGMTCVETTSPTRRAAAARRVHGRLHRAHLAAHDGRHQPRVDLLVADEPHVGGLHHRVRGLDHRDQPAALDHPQRFHPFHLP